MGEKEKKLQEDHEIVNKRNKVLVSKIQEIEKKNNKENKAAIELLEKKTDEYTKKFKNQVKVKDENLQVLKE